MSIFIFDFARILDFNPHGTNVVIVVVFELDNGNIMVI
jgi:hypothetical protein